MPLPESDVDLPLWSDLEEGILEKIFLALSSRSDRQAARLVCKPFKAIIDRLVQHVYRELEYRDLESPYERVGSMLQLVQLMQPVCLAWPM